jgi:hypothetical protein
VEKGAEGQNFLLRQKLINHAKKLINHARLHLSHAEALHLSILMGDEKSNPSGFRPKYQPSFMVVGEPQNK